MRVPFIWGTALLCSVALHALAGLVLLRSVDPDPVNEQPVPETRMQLSAHKVTQSTAVEAQPETTTAQSEDAAGAQVQQGAIPQSSATSISVPSIELRPEDQAAREQALTPVQDKPLSLETAEVTAPPLIAASLPLNAVETGIAPTQAVTLVAPRAESATAVEAQPVALTQTLPEAETAKATDVFSAAGDGPVDPVSLAAFQSFTRPEDVGQSAQDLRDGIDGLLSQVPCARLQVQFQPETNTLELIGHIPEDGLRDPVLSALQARMGENIQVADNLLILPRPQCGALSGISSVGLPQSTDQITNPLLVGEDVHAREFRYTQGQQLVLDLTGADYDAYIYVDFFDAAGQVIHLSPNSSVSLTKTPAKAPLKIGAEQQGDPGLFITIGPPYGQEIVAAFASSVPLHAGDRPLVEPAGPYLDFLAQSVTNARAAHPDFKGEWVYFFVTTSAR